MRREDNAMRAAMPGMVLVMVFFCMVAVTIIVDTIGIGMIIYHTFKQPFKKRPIKKIWNWAAVVLIVTSVAGFVSMIAFYVYLHI